MGRRLVRRLSIRRRQKPARSRDRRAQSHPRRSLERGFRNLATPIISLRSGAFRAELRHRVSLRKESETVADEAAPCEGGGVIRSISELYAFSGIWEKLPFSARP